MLFDLLNYTTLRWSKGGGLLVGTSSRPSHHLLNPHDHHGQIDQESLGSLDHSDGCYVYVLHSLLLCTTRIDAGAGSVKLTPLVQIKWPPPSKASFGPKYSGTS